MFTARACRFNSYTYLQRISYVARKSYAHAFARTLQLINININQPYLFWVAAGYVPSIYGEGHVISHHSKCFSSTCASMHMVVIHSQLFCGYH